MDTSLDALNSLLEERTRYERWLVQLAERREQTPPHVFERVRGDYSARLEGVMNQLGSRAAELETSARSLEARVSGLLAEETARRDARAEVELRALVGEYTAEVAEARLAECDIDINRLEGDRRTATGELERLQEILSLVRRAPPPAPREEPRAPAMSPESTDELAFLQSVLDQGDSPRSQADRVVNGPVPGSSGPQPSVRQPVPSQPSGSTPVNTPAFLRDMPTEQVKTLKCQECGTMNYPTEWYCERCGGELAAM